MVILNMALANPEIESYSYINVSIDEGDRAKISRMVQYHRGVI